MMTAPLVGRDTELTVLGDLVTAAVAGRGRLVVITGEAGIGKTRLLEVVVQKARERGLPVLAGRAVEGGGALRPIADALLGAVRSARIDATPQLSAFRGALGRLLPGWDAAAPSETGVDPVLVLGEGVLRLLDVVAPQGCAVVLEDLHWADADSLALLEYLGGVVTGMPILIAVTARSWPRIPTLERIQQLPTVLTVPLPRLTAGQVDELMRTVGGRLDADARRLVSERSEGLPFLVSELVGGLLRGTTEVPPSFTALVDRRLADLSDGSRRLLAAAAVWGLDPDWELAATLSALTPEETGPALREAVRAELLVSGRDDLGWRHALTREAVLATLLAPERRRLSLRAADLLLAQDPPAGAAHAAELLLVGGADERAVDVLVRLAEQDLRTGALRSAETVLARAAGTGIAAARVTAVWIDLLMLSGRLAEALAAGDATIGEAVGDEHAELCLRLARTAIAAGQWTRADGYLARAGRPRDPRSLVLTADAAHGAGDVDRAWATAADAVQQAETADPAVLCEALCVQARIGRLSDPAAAKATFARAAQTAAEHGLRPWRVEALLGQGTAELLEDESSEAIMEAQRLAVDLGLILKAAGMELVLADHVFLVDGPRALAGPARRLGEAGRILRDPALALVAETLAGVREALGGERGAGGGPAVRAGRGRPAAGGRRADRRGAGLRRPRGP